MKTVKFLSILVAAFFLAACSRVPSNVHALSTEDCGATWRLLKAAASVPKHTTNPCGYNTAIPAWPMSGDTGFRTQFENKVTTVARISYTYEITDPVPFLSEARYLGKMGGTLEISAGGTDARFEMAENTIIDKLIREVTTDLTRTMDLVNTDPSKLEMSVQKSVTEELKKKGITLGDMAFVLEMDDLTRMAIDTATAVRIYQASGIGELGKDIMKARAGAAQITVTN